MSARREHPAGLPRTTSPFPRRASVSTHQPPPATPQFGREPHIAYGTPPARPSEPPTRVERDFPQNVPKGPKALYNPTILPSSGAGGGGNGPPAHSPHKSSFSQSSALSPHQSGHSHHYAQPGGQGSGSRGSAPPSAPRASAGRGASAMPPAGQSRSPVSAHGSGGIATSGGPVFAPSYATSNESDRGHRFPRRRSSEWDSGSLGGGRGGRGRSREHDYPEYGRGGGSDYGTRGGFGGSSFRDRDRDRGGYRARSREREAFQHRARSSSRERERGVPSLYSGRDRTERGSFGGDRRPGFDRERPERVERERERERDRERERPERERERERYNYKPPDRDSRESRATERSREVREAYDPNREREKRTRDAAEYNRNREAERARFSLPHPGTPPPSVPAYGYHPVVGLGPSSYPSSSQQSQQPRTQNGTSTAGQWALQGRRSVGGGMNNTLPPMIQSRDRDKDHDKERTERDVTGKVDYRLDTRTSDRVSQPKKEVTEDGKLISPLSTELKVPTPSTAHAPSTGITPVSATSSRPYSPPPPPPPPPQPPSGPRATTGALPPTGPRGGPPPTGPRAGVDRESRKDADRKWGSKERGGSAEYWNNTAQPQPQPQQHPHPQPQSQGAPVKQPAAGSTVTRLDIIGHVHPDRIREIETAVKGEDDRDRTPTRIPQHIPEQPASFGSVETAVSSANNDVWTTPAHPAQRASSTTLSGPSRPGSSSSSRQGFNNILNPVNGSSYGPTSSTHNSVQPTPTALASVNNSPTKSIHPPTAPRALQQAPGPRGAYWRGRSFRSGNNFGSPIVKREVGDDGGAMSGYRGGRGTGGMSMSIGVRDSGSMGRGMDRSRRGSRPGMDMERPVAREDVEMADSHTHFKAKEVKEEKRSEASPKEIKDVEFTGVVKPMVETREPIPDKLLSLLPQTQLTPVIKIEDQEEEDDDVSLTQADVALKIVDIDKELEQLAKKLAELSKCKAGHFAEVAEIDREIELAAEAARSRSPKTMEPEVKVVVEKAVIETESDEQQLQQPEPQQLPLEDDYDMLKHEKEELLHQQQEERKQEERVEQQLQAQFHQQQEMRFNHSGEVLGTISLSPSPLPSVSNSPTPSEAVSTGSECDESLRNGSNNRHPAHPDLPFFRPGPPMKPSDYDFFRANTEEHEHLRELIVAHISEERKAAYEKETSLKRKFKELFEPWYEKCQDMDKDATRKKKGASEPAEMGASPAPATIVAPETVGRRAGRNAPSDVVRSEAEMEQVLKGLAEEEQQKAADTKAKDQNAREAVVPGMIMDPSEILVFKDTNRLLRTKEEVLAVFQFDVPPDDWNEMEQKIFCERYAQFPKQWGKIAQEIEGRDFKACISHYYMTKKTCNYKELVRGPGKRGARKGKRKQASSQRTRQSALIAGLGRGGGVGTGEDDEGADSEDVTPAAITETGRPKRAAAPVFGGDASNNNNNNNIDSETIGVNGGGIKRGGRDPKGDDDAEKTEKGTKRSRGGNNSGRGGGQKRVKMPANMVVQPSTPVSTPPVLAPVPEGIEKKEEKKGEDFCEREPDAINLLPAKIEVLPEPMVVEDKKPVIVQQLNPQVQIPTEQPQTPLQQPPTLPTTPVPLPPSTPTPKKEKGAEKPVAQTSSYWSVPEQSDFPHLLASYGTNWAMISQRLASKTTVMVRNFYTRQVENGKTEYKEIADDADRKINAGQRMPEPPKPAALPKKRYDTGSTSRTSVSGADPSAGSPQGTPGPPTIAISSMPSTPTPNPIPVQVQIQVQAQPSPMQGLPPPLPPPPPASAPVPIKEEVVVTKPVMPPQLQPQPQQQQQPPKIVEAPQHSHSHSSSNLSLPLAHLQKPASVTILVQNRNTVERPHGSVHERLQQGGARQIRVQERAHQDRTQQGGIHDRMHERLREGFNEGSYGGLHDGLPSARIQEQLQERSSQDKPQGQPQERLQERPHQSPPGTSQHPRILQQGPQMLQKLQGQPQQQQTQQVQQQQIHVPNQIQQPRAYFQETHHHRTSSQPTPISQQAFAPPPQQRPNAQPVNGPSVEQRHQNPAVMEQRHQNPPSMEHRHQNPAPMQQSHQNLPPTHQPQQGHHPPSHQLQAPRPISASLAVQQLVAYQSPMPSAPQHQAPRPQVQQSPANQTPPPSTPASFSKRPPTSIHSLLNPAKEDPPPRPQSRATYFSSQTRSQTPQQQQQQQQQLQHPQPQHPPQHQQPQHAQHQHPQPQHSQLQHSQPQHSQSQHTQVQPHLHTQLREPPRGGFSQYEQAHSARQSMTQLPLMMAGGSHTHGVPRAQISPFSGPACPPLARDVVSYSSGREPRESALYSSASQHRESTPQPTFSQPAHRKTLSGPTQPSHQQSQGPTYPRPYNQPRTPYQQSGPYTPPPMPASSHPHPHSQQHPHHQQQGLPLHQQHHSQPGHPHHSQHPHPQHQHMGHPSQQPPHLQYPPQGPQYPYHQGPPPDIYERGR